MMWAFLGTAILLEVGGTLSLRESQGLRRGGWAAATLIAYVLSTVLLWLTLRSGMALGVAYGIWAATGVALTALAGRTLFKDPLTPAMLLGIAAIAGGVLLIETGAH